MRADIEALRNYRHLSERILSSLASGDQSEFILAQLRKGQTVDDICTALGGGSSPTANPPRSRMRWEPGSATSHPGSPSVGKSNSRTVTQDSAEGSLPSCDVEKEEGEEGSCQKNDEQWTTVTADEQMIEHLLSLYFCWEYPIFAALSKNHFLMDFRAGRRRYCSSLLVNAILALGCRFSDWPTSEAAEIQFFAEAERLYALEQDDPSLTTVQSMGLMSLHEASCGKDVNSRFYSGQSISIAIEMGLHLQDSQNEISADEYSVRNITFWGAFSLDQ